MFIRLTRQLPVEHIVFLGLNVDVVEDPIEGFNLARACSAHCVVLESDSLGRKSSLLRSSMHRLLGEGQPRGCLR